MEAPRKIQQIAALTFGTKSEQQLITVALCNDGSVWSIRPDKLNPYWEQLPDIPQPEAKGDAK